MYQYYILIYMYYVQQMKIW